MENIDVLDKLPWGMRYSVLGHDFNASELIIYINQGVLQQKYTENIVP